MMKWVVIEKEGNAESPFRNQGKGRCVHGFFKSAGNTDGDERFYGPGKHSVLKKPRFEINLASG
jgi:hypothetical protein